MTATGNYYPSITFDANRSAENNAIMWLNGKWNGTDVGSISVEAGDDTTNKDDGKITFYTAQGGTSTRKMAIEQDGNVHIDTGNIVIGTSGKGIDFSATSNTSATGASMSNELLDDYEEGSWTPAARNAGSFTSPTGRYVKIGHQVTIWGYIGTITDITSSSNMQISGLPYTATSSNHTEFVGPVMMRFQSVTNQNGATFTTYQASGWDYLSIYASRDDGNNYEAAKHEDWNFTSAGIRFCHSYTV